MEMTNTYSMNWFLGRDGSYGADDPGYLAAPDGASLHLPISQTAIGQPANTVAYLLTNSAPPSGRDWGCLFTTLKSSDFTNRIRFRPVYNDGGNIAFADGHAKFFRAKEADANRDPLLDIYHWPSRGIWMQPTMPESTMGYENSEGIG
jgi:prepilin-type processing-associated H-X9-DG protein